MGNFDFFLELRYYLSFGYGILQDIHKHQKFKISLHTISACSLTFHFLQRLLEIDPNGM